MSAPWEKPEVIHAAEEFLRQEEAEGRHYPVSIRIERQTWMTVTRCEVQVSDLEFCMRVDAFMSRNDWPNDGNERHWLWDRETVEHAVMIRLRDHVLREPPL